MRDFKELVTYCRDKYSDNTRRIEKIEYVSERISN